MTITTEEVERMQILKQCSKMTKSQLVDQIVSMQERHHKDTEKINRLTQERTEAHNNAYDFEEEADFYKDTLHTINDLSRRENNHG